MRVAFAGCAETLSEQQAFPDTLEGHTQQVWTHEHRSQFLPVLEAFRDNLGDEVVALDWRRYDHQKPEHRFDLIFVGAVYDYPQHIGEFKKFLQRAQAAAIVANDPRIIEWNAHKRYLLELEAKGLPVIPCMFLERPTSLGDIFKTFGEKEIVIKPVTGLGGLGVERFKAGDDPDRMIATDFMIQPYRPAIQQGELSYIFINGQFSHAIIKQCKGGEFRVHAEYGGSVGLYEPPQAEIDIASRFVEAFPTKPLLCRIDVIRKGAGVELMEVDGVDRYPFPVGQPNFGKLMHQAFSDCL